MTTDSRRHPVSIIRRSVLASLLITAIAVPAVAGAAPAKSPFVRHVEALCAADRRAEAKVKQPSVNPVKVTVKQLPIVARYLGQLAPIVHTLAQGARSLGTPPTGGATYALLVTAWSKLAADMDRDVATAKSGAAAELRRQIPTEFAQSAKADALAKRFGAITCA
jgi:hypothetical protein